MSEPFSKISVVMPVYNGANYIREAVESILNQTFTDFEFIVIDDCSTDRSWEILTKYANQDQRVKLFKNEENLGVTKSLNKGLKLAQGDYIARQDADDVSLPERFEKQVALLELDSEVVLASCNIEFVDAEGHSLATFRRECDRELIAWYLIFYNYLWGHSQVMFRRKSAMDLGGYCESHHYNEDYELWCRLIKVGSMVILPEVLLQRRKHSRSISSEKASEQKNYSLSQSRHNIKQLIGEELSLEEVEDFRVFGMITENWEYFTKNLKFSGEKAEKLHSRLKKLYRAFLQETAPKGTPDPKLSCQLRILIGEQFLFWSQLLSKRHNLGLKLRISLYAFFWSPLRVLKYWLRELWRLPLSLSRALASSSCYPSHWHQSSGK